MTSYEPVYPGGWRDKPDTSTPIDAAALDHLEAGIEAAMAAALAAAPMSTAAVKSAAYTSVGNEIVPADATSAGFTVKLPNGPLDATRVIVKKIDASANAVVVQCQGSAVLNKSGGSTSVSLTLTNQAVFLQYKAAGAIWYIVSDDLPLASLRANLDGVYAPQTRLVNGHALTGDVTLSAADVSAVGLDSQVVNACVNTYGHQMVATTASDQIAALNALIRAVPSGTEIIIPPGSYGAASGIEIVNKVSLRAAFPYSVRFVAMAGFSDHQMLRNWQASDYTVGETDHTLAPNNTALPNYYVSIRNGVAFDVNGASNTTAAAFVHIQERSILELIISNTPNTGSGNRGIAFFSNADAAGNCAGRYTVTRIIHYGTGWDHFVWADGSNGGKQAAGMLNDFKLVDFTSAPGGAGASYNDSPFYIRQASNVDLDIHCEGSPPVGATDSAIVRLIDVAGCSIRGTLNSGGYDMYRPYVRATSTGTLSAPWKALSPELDHLNIGGLPHSGSGNIIEDEIPVNGVATSRHFAYDATTFAPVRILHYDGASIRYLDKFNVAHEDRLPDLTRENAPSTAVAQAYGERPKSNGPVTITSGRLVLVPVYLYVGQVVSIIKWISNTTALAGGSNQWSALFDPSRNLLAISADDTSNAWAASTQKPFTLLAPQTITKAGIYYLALCVVATTPPTIIGENDPQVTNSLAPVRWGFADSGLTNPASCPATAASPSAINSKPWAYAS